MKIVVVSLILLGLGGRFGGDEEQLPELPKPVWYCPKLEHRSLHTSYEDYQKLIENFEAVRKMFAMTRDGLQEDQHVDTPASSSGLPSRHDRQHDPLQEKLQESRLTNPKGDELVTGDVVEAVNAATSRLSAGDLQPLLQKKDHARKS